MQDVSFPVVRPARKGILLAGGAGTRLHPMTIPVSKQLLPVCDKSLVCYPLSVLMLAGVREVLVVSTPRDLPAFRGLLGDGATIFAYRVRNPKEFGVVRLDASDHLLELVEKPQAPTSPWAIIGLYLMDADAPRLARELSPSPREELEIVDLLGKCLEAGNLQVEPFGRGGAWLDKGTPRSLLHAAHFVEIIQERQGLHVASPEGFDG